MAGVLSFVGTGYGCWLLGGAWWTVKTGAIGAALLASVPIKVMLAPAIVTVAVPVIAVQAIRRWA